MIAERAGILGAEELRRAAAFRLDIARDRFLWRRIWRRHVLGACLGAPPESLAFTQTCDHCGDAAHGKPRLAGIEFSASQSGDITVIATGDAPLGVDVQMTAIDLPDIARQILSPREAALWRSEGGTSAEWLASLWARKEAFLKTDGIGLAVEPCDVDAIGCGLRHECFGPIRRPGRPEWQVASWLLDEGAVVALSCESERAVRWRRLPIAESLNL